MTEGVLEEVRSSQLEDTKRVASQALSQMIPAADPAFGRSENKPLKQGWIDYFKDWLSKPSEPGAKTIRMWSGTDAALADQSKRGFVFAFLRYLGSNLKYEDVSDIVSGRVRAKRIKDEEIENPRDEKTVIVEDEKGRIKYLATKTKIDGLQVVFDGSAITAPTHTDRTVRPMLSITTK